MIDKQGDTLGVYSDSVICRKDKALSINLSALGCPGDLPHVINHHPVRRIYKGVDQFLLFVFGHSHVDFVAILFSDGTTQFR